MSSIESISAISLGVNDNLVGKVQENQMVSGNTFVQHLNELNNQLQVSDLNLQDIASGKPVAMHEALIQIQQAKLSLEFVVETRNKLLESYQQVMRMQI